MQRVQGQSRPDPELPLWSPRAPCRDHFTEAESDVPGKLASRLDRVLEKTE